VVTRRQVVGRIAQADQWPDGRLQRGSQIGLGGQEVLLVEERVPDPPS